ncbi:MAG: DNA primase, partial [bacterium]
EKKGKSYWGLCPFHPEKTPSFAVTPEMGIYKCFGCGEGGDIFSFLMNIEGCEFLEAMKMLAQRSGVELPSEKEDGKQNLRRKLFEINEYAMGRYREAFWKKIGAPARRYMFDRGFNEEILKEFKIGFAPEGWRNLVKALQRDGYQIEHALKSGLIGKSKNGKLFDKFRDRIIFPICSLSGRVEAFGGRILKTDEDSPKYLNSADTPIFSKRETLYGLHQARARMRETNRCLIMEGYTDVMSCHQHGYHEAVGTLGTAFTEGHARLLRRYIDEIVLIYDGDPAGQQAAQRGGGIALKNGLKASVVILPEGSDPADILTADKKIFTSAIENRIPYLEALFNWLSQKYPPDSVEGKEEILKGMTPLLKELPGGLKRQEQARKLAEKLSISEELILRQLSRRRQKKGTGLEERLKRQTGQNIEETFFRSLSSHPGKFKEAMKKISKKDFSDKRSKVLMEGLIKLKNENRKFYPRTWLEVIPSEQRPYLAGLLSWDDNYEFAAGIDPVEIASMLKNTSIRRERTQLARAMEKNESQDSNESETQKALLEQAMLMKQQEQKDLNLD